LSGPDPEQEAYARERRKALRAALLVRVEFQAPESSYSIGLCENISETGMWVKTADPFAVSQPVTLRFVLPPVGIGMAVRTRAIVVRAEPGVGAAFEFVELQARYRDAIVKYVARSGKG
jgi:PilZ domain